VPISSEAGWKTSTPISASGWVVTERVTVAGDDSDGRLLLGE
jgi:hypothetical protein